MNKFKQYLILPLGSYEYHGNGMPLNTDSVIAEKIAGDFAKALKRQTNKKIVLLPILNFGLSLEHSDFSETIWISHQTFYNFVYEILNSAAKKNNIIITINGHGGNVHTLSTIETNFNYTHDNCKVIVPQIFTQKIKELCEKLFGEFDSHAGSVESSLLSFYHNTPKKMYHTHKSKKFSGSLRFFKTKVLYPHGIIKETSIIETDPKKGEILHSAIIDNLIKQILELIPHIENPLKKYV